MEKGCLNRMSPFLGALLISAPALPAWGEPPAEKGSASDKVVIVAESGGSYNSPLTAMANVATWCGRPSETNRCLVKILPGVYDLGGESLTMQPYVDIEGSGENATIIAGAPASSEVINGVVNGADNAEIRFLTVKVRAAIPSNYTVAIANNSQSPNINHVTTIASGGWHTCGIYNSASSPKISHVTASTTEGEYNYGIYNSASSPNMTNVTASVTTGFTACGVYNSASSPTMDNVTASGTEGHFNYGVYNDTSSSPKMRNVTASSSGTNTYAVYNFYSSPTMSNVTVTSSGGTNVFGIENINSSPTMSNITVTATGGSMSLGVLNQSSSSTIMRNVTITASGEYANGVSNLDSSPIMHNVTVYLPRDSGYASAGLLVNPAASKAKIGSDDIKKLIVEHSLDKLGALMRP